MRRSPTGAASSPAPTPGGEGSPVVRAKGAEPPRALPAWALVVAYAGLVSALSHMSRPPVPRPLQTSPATFALHVVEFAGFAFFFYRALGRSRPGWSPLALLAVTVSATAAFGVLDELHQSFVPGRFCQALDVLADTLGGAAAATVMTVLSRRNRTPGG